MTFSLTATTTKEAALAALQSGELTPDQYLKWDKAQSKTAKLDAPKECPITLVEFLADSPPMAIQVGNHLATAKPTKFSTGSFGYGYNGKMQRTVNGKDVKFQVSMTVTVVNSKHAKS